MLARPAGGLGEENESYEDVSCGAGAGRGAGKYTQLTSHPLGRELGENGVRDPLAVSGAQVERLALQILHEYVAPSTLLFS